MVTKSFYVVDMEMIEDDTIHLKSLVWPLLQTLYGSEYVPEFHKQSCSILVEAGITLTKLIETMAKPHLAGKLQGKGTCGLRGSCWILFPHLDFKLISDYAIGCL
jgi:hypothetical protein